MEKLDKQNLVYKCLKDSSFKEELKKNPNKVLKREFGVTIPNNMEIMVIEETPEVKYIVIPHVSAEEELTETELQAVAGAGPDRSLRTGPGYINPFDRKGKP